LKRGQFSSEAYSKHGISPTAVLFDETHVANREMMNVMLHGAAGARKQPINFLITTAGNDFNSIGYELHQKTVDILEGRKVDYTFYPTIYAADENDDWTSPEVWKKANPSLGVTVDIEKMQIACENARQNAAEEKFIILPYFWIPDDNLKIRVRWDHVPYDIWEKQGFIKTTEGNVVHYGFIEAFIEELGTKYNIKEIAFDRWGAVQMVQNLEGMGFTVIPFGQGYKDMSPPSKELMKLTLEKKIVHGGNPVLRWMMDNIFVKTDPAGNIKPDKEKSTERIDGAVALIMALDRAIRNENKSSVYDERGISVF
jgi:phage terminase large subunit-like protein